MQTISKLMRKAFSYIIGFVFGFILVFKLFSIISIKYRNTDTSINKFICKIYNLNRLTIIGEDKILKKIIIKNKHNGKYIYYLGQNREYNINKNYGPKNYEIYFQNHKIYEFGFRNHNNWQTFDYIICISEQKKVYLSIYPKSNVKLFYKRIL
jgi:hypothetical protein